MYYHLVLPLCYYYSTTMAFGHVPWYSYKVPWSTNAIVHEFYSIVLALSSISSFIIIYVFIKGNLSKIKGYVQKHGITHSHAQVMAQ